MSNSMTNTLKQMNKVHGALFHIFGRNDLLYDINILDRKLEGIRIVKCLPKVLHDSL